MYESRIFWCHGSVIYVNDRVSLSFSNWICDQRGETHFEVVFELLILLFFKVFEVMVFPKHLLNAETFLGAGLCFHHLLNRPWAANTQPLCCSTQSSVWGFQLLPVDVLCVFVVILMLEIPALSPHKIGAPQQLDQAQCIFHVGENVSQLVEHSYNFFLPSSPTPPPPPPYLPLAC